MLSKFGDIITIISFFITVITLFTTLGIKKKIEETVDKQQYFKERVGYIKKLKKYYSEINNSDILYSVILSMLRDVYHIMEQICGYKLWKKDDVLYFEELKDITEKMLNEIESYHDKYKLRIEDTFISCPYCGMRIQVGSQCVCGYKSHKNEIVQDTVITEKFKNEYCTALSKVISILEKESKML